MQEDKIKIVGICASHRTEKNTFYALTKCMEGIRTLGIAVETEIIDLSKKRIEDCKGCHVCFLRAGDGICCPVINDDMNEIYPKLIEADGIIAASPVHWWSSTAKMRRFIDRTNAFCGAGNTEYAGALYNKVGGVIAVAYDVHGGTEVAATHMATWMLAENMIVVGTQGAHIGGTASTNLGVPTAGAESVKNDHHGMKTVYEVGKRVAETAYIMKHGRDSLINLKNSGGMNHDQKLKITQPAEIDWDRFYEYENSFPKEHYGIEGQLATSEVAFKKFIEKMTTRKKNEGNTWGVISDIEAFKKMWLEKRNLKLLSDQELYNLCPEYYNYYLKRTL